MTQAPQPGSGGPYVDHLEPKRGDGQTPRPKKAAPSGKDAIPDALVQVNMDAGPRFEGGGEDAKPRLSAKAKGTPKAAASANAGDPTFKRRPSTRKAK